MLAPALITLASGMRLLYNNRTSLTEIVTVLATIGYQRLTESGLEVDGCLLWEITDAR